MANRKRYPLGYANVVLLGNLVAKPKVYEDQDGRLFCPFVVGICQLKRGKVYNDYPKCAAWGKVARRMGEWGFKGQRVLVVGGLRRKPGQGRSKAGNPLMGPMEVAAAFVQFQETRDKRQVQPEPRANLPEAEPEDWSGDEEAIFGDGDLEW